MLLPFDRNRLGRRNALDAEEEAAGAERRSPAESLLFTLELCEMVAELATATIGEQPASDLALKARLYVVPLRAAMHS